MKKFKKDFVIKLCSDCDFENLVADVYWKNHPFLMLSCENGAENIEIEIYPLPEGMASWTFPLKDYLEVIEAAKKHLLEKEL